jgi:murein L,D-transpeptidase YafK
MNRLHVKFSLSLLIAILATGFLFAQPLRIETGQPAEKEGVDFDKLKDTLKKEFEVKKLAWPPQNIYIRSFKYDRLLELWVKNKTDESYTLFKSYKVCMQSGSIGPKRAEGDKQVPEGFYYVNEFNANSNYHLSLGLNYPNAADKILSDAKRPGGDIYIHGKCVSTGCIAIQDNAIEEVYLIAEQAKTNGQDFIPVHIFPVKYDVPQSLNYLTETVQGSQSVLKFILSVKAVFDYFEEKKQIPVILVNKKGDYVIN